MDEEVSGCLEPSDLSQDHGAWMKSFFLFVRECLPSFLLLSVLSFLLPPGPHPPHLATSGIFYALLALDGYYCSGHYYFSLLYFYYFTVKQVSIYDVDDVTFSIEMYVRIKNFRMICWWQ